MSRARWLCVVLIKLVILGGLLLPTAGAAAHEGHTDHAPPDSEFQVVTLAKGADKTGEPIAMAVLPDRSVLHTARDGRVFLTRPNATTELAATIPVYSHDEDGLQGIAVDPDFATNRWVYLYYAPPLNTPAGDAPHTGDGPEAFQPYVGHNQLSRVKLTEAGTLDMATEQKILQVPADRGICCHAGGEIDFDADGNLLLSTGDDTDPFNQEGFTPIDERPTRNPAFDAQRSSANSNDLRGKLLRITVQPDGSYTVPAGNLFPEAEDTGDKTRPEIYAMGFRNPFRFAVDRTTGWIFLGDYGPDASASDPNRGPAGQVEFNLIKEPGNYGWPYCHGKNDAYNDYDFGTRISGDKFDCATPDNDSPRNTGLTQLPPAVPATVAYDNCSIVEFGCGSESPMGGPTYRYDAENPSPTKFPQYFDGKQFAYEFGRAWIKALTFDEAGTMAGIDPIMDSFDFKQLISLEFGPDGSLYVLDYGTGFFSGDENSALYRIDYVQGTRSPVAEASADKTSGPAPLEVSFTSSGSTDPDGTPISYEWDFDADGTVDSTEPNPTFTYTEEGRYTAVLTVTDETGMIGSASVNIVAGNTAPVVDIQLPPGGAFFDYGDTIPFTIKATDPEDGTVDCQNVQVNTALGHNDHAHGHQSLTGCSGTVDVPAAWEDASQRSTFVITASYTDTAKPGLELTTSSQTVLEHRTLQAEYFDGQQGSQVVNHDAAAGGRRVGYIEGGDWLRFDDINLSGIDQVSAGVASWQSSELELRRGSPTGQLLATVPVGVTGSGDAHEVQGPVPIVDPGTTFDLYVVFTGGGLDLDELTFGGQGAKGNASPQLDVTVAPMTGTVPLEVDFDVAVTDPEGTDVAVEWDFGDGTTSANASTSHTYDRRGDYAATLTATDGDGRTSVQTFDIEASPDCSAGTPAPSDEFDGTELDYCRWTSLIREDTAHYRVADGALTIDALDGDMYEGTTTAQNLVLQDAPAGAWEAVTKVALPEGEEFEQAGLMVHSGDSDFVKLNLMDIPGSGWRVEFGQVSDGMAEIDETLDRSGELPAGINTDGIWLKLASNGLSLTGSWSADGQAWHTFDRTKSLHGMSDPKVGLAAFNGSGQPAAFDFFHLTETGELACQTAATPEEGYRMLFDGTSESLAQWQMAGPGSFALQDDCSILSKGGLGLLYHPEQLESYSLKLDWKMAGDDNSGVFVGFQDPGDDPFRAVNQGHEIQIDATDDADSTTGAIYNVQASDTELRDRVVNPPGEWNTYEIVVLGDRIQVLLNGTKINDFTNTDPGRMNPPSMIGIQNHGAEDDVYFRDIQVKDLPTPTGEAPTLDITGPASGTVSENDTATVTGTTNAVSAEVRIGGKRIDATLTDGEFAVDVPLELGSNKIIVNAFAENGLTATAQTTVIARNIGTKVGGFTDPEGDDDGPGSYTYPTNSAYAPGGFDLTGLDVYTDGDTVSFVTGIAGEIVNPWGGDKISHQRVNVYLGSGGDVPAPALPGTNMDTASPWQVVVVIDGRFDTAGVYAPDGTRIAGGKLFAIPQTKEIGISVPSSAFANLDLATATYGTAMFANAEESEGIGFIRPVYDFDFWNAGDPWWIKEHRLGGGAGVWDDSAAHDTDVRDPNSIDVIVGDGQSQATVLDWTAGAPTKLPMLNFGGGGGDTDTTAPVTELSTDPSNPDGDAGWFTSPVTVSLAASDEGSGIASTEYRLDGGEWTAYGEPFVVDVDGEHVVEFRSTDEAGNVEDTRRSTVKLDGNGPKVEVTGVVDGESYGDSGTVILGWQATDASSGVAETTAKFDGETVEDATELELWSLPLGSHELVVTATDVAGHRTVKTVAFTTETSADDLEALVTMFRDAGQVDAKQARALLELVDRARHEASRGNYDGAAGIMKSFVRKASKVEDEEARSTLVRDGRTVREQYMAER